MRHRDPHDDPHSRRRNEPYRGPPVTLGHIRSRGVKRLLIYCFTGLCHHSAVTDRWPDETVLLEGGLHQVRDDRRGRGAELERPVWKA